MLVIFALPGYLKQILLYASSFVVPSLYIALEGALRHVLGNLFKGRFSSRDALQTLKMFSLQRDKISNGTG